MSCNRTISNCYIIVNCRHFRMKLIKSILACMIGYYGENCDQKCGQCHNSIGCNVTNGYCSDGCVMGYWGNNCKNPCKTCVKGCHMMDGNCTDGACPSGYQGAKCSEGKFKLQVQYLTLFVVRDFK